jgi:glycosyltransferase involved in cell wall biosynthesis
MISVCIATYNGEKYIKEQLESILVQIGDEDEVIISDDGSTDNTIDIINNINDKRVNIYKNPKNGVVSNFENAISIAKGNLIFLSDQDDIWHPNKIEIMMSYLLQYICVVCDTDVIYEGDVIYSSYNKLNGSNVSYYGTLITNPFVGSAMAFNSKIKNYILPFPQNIPMHDLWIGVVSKFFFNVILLNDVLMSHRLHNSNFSSTAKKSKNSIFTKIKYRIILITNILKLKINKWIENY